MGKMKLGIDSRNKNITEITKKVMKKHENTFKKLSENDSLVNEYTGSSFEEFIQQPEVIIREIQTIEKQQDIHHHTVVNKIKTVDKRTRKYAKALRKESYKQREVLSRLINTVQKVQSGRMDKIENSIKNIQIPEQNQVVTQIKEVKEIQYVLDKRLIAVNVVMLLISLAILVLK